MKKKFISLVVFLFSIFFIGNIEVFAENNPYSISAHDIPSDTYIIGTHAFDENRTYLSTQDIMWAARTIDAESINDMIIYYKDMNGVWIDGLSGENITVPSTFKLEAVNGKVVQSIAINTVLEEVDYGNGATGYSSIHEDDYNIAGLWLKNDGNKTEYDYDIIFDAFNINDGEYGFDLQCHSYTIDEGEDTPQKFSVGTTPPTITISNGQFRLPIEFDITTINDYVSCKIELEKDDEVIESGFTIGLGDAEPTLNAFAIEMTAEEANGEGIGFYPIFTDYPNDFYDIYDSGININEFALIFKSRFIEEGDYNVEIIATKDDEKISVDYDEVFIVGDGADPTYGLANAKHYLTFDEPITAGEYQFEIKLIDANDKLVLTEYIYLTVTGETKMEISSEVWETTNNDEIYYDIDELKFDSSKTRTFSVTFFTENIQAGTYAVKTNLEYIDMVIPANFDFIANQNVQVIKQENIEYFDYEFKIPKGAGAGEYYVDLTLHEIIEDEFGSNIVNEQPIAKSTIKFTIIPETPKLQVEQLFEAETYNVYDFRINNLNDIDGWELYAAIDNNGDGEITEEEINILDNSKNDMREIKISHGKKNKFVTRSYKILRKSGSEVLKLYSNYSEEIKVPSEKTQ